LVDAKTDSILATNLPLSNSNKNDVINTIKRLKKSNNAIPINFSSKQNSLLYYDDSPELKKLQYFPYVQFIIFALFIFVGYLIFNTFRKAEQNQVWAGMAKETAHQLGTPLSSLMAWVQYLESQNIDQSIALEMQKDVNRLEQVANRFSKIGSSTQLENKNIVETVQTVINYLKNRVSSKIIFEVKSDAPEMMVDHNPPLIEWVIENITKNAVDSMETAGKLTIQIQQEGQHIHIDIQDTGKGIPHSEFKTIFKPGYTTKKRGWGLGLSLVKRIINEYHQGKVYVLQSEIDKGTTFRISLKN
jgi:signal transduction histidine kinase